ncbi:thiamine-phosphate kinase [Glycocaulis abyssi]|uniref:Thiamine-monophosphate kinase n=1 Tax=Glycocaulis abyssi TaxID=1433403 RepID=A0ABV9N6A3_9PROT
MSGKGEFGFIRNRLAPLAAGFKGALGLADDAAVLTVRAGRELVITADTLVEGRHFPEGTDPALVARKALRVNLSDLAAMGARPVGYMTSVVWPSSATDTLRNGFADGLASDQEIFDIALIGGDTTSADGPWVISVTAFGEVPAGKAMTRSGAKPGDCLVVSGTIGDAYLGLRIAKKEFSPSAEDRAYLLERLELPVPRLALADALHAHAGAAIDISDGLIADSRHLAVASGLSLEIDLDALPLSDAARRWLGDQDDTQAARLALASFGDDYELACAVPPARVDTFVAELRKAGLGATVVGVFAPGDKVQVFSGGAPVEYGAGGFTHF